MSLSFRAVAAVLAIGFARLHRQPVAENPMVGGAAMFADKNIIENAVNSKDHTTLVAAVQAAGLVETLSGAGPFTVFAPTNDAFAKLPAGTVENLLKPENKDMLTKILTCHVVGKAVMAEALQGMIKDDNGNHPVIQTLGGCDAERDLCRRQDHADRRERQCRHRHHRRCRPVERRDPRHRHGAPAEDVSARSLRAGPLLPSPEGTIRVIPRRCGALVWCGVTRGAVLSGAAPKPFLRPDHDNSEPGC